MKKMRFFIIILIGLISLISCSNENNEPITENNLIVGTWKAIREVNVCSTGSKLISVYSECALQTRYTFRAHSDPAIKNKGTADIKIFYNQNDKCIEVNYSNGTWELNDEILIFTSNGGFPFPPLTIFKLDSNLLQIGNNTNVENLACDGDKLSSYQYRELTKVE